MHRSNVLQECMTIYYTNNIEPITLYHLRFCLKWKVVYLYSGEHHNFIKQTTQDMSFSSTHVNAVDEDFLQDTRLSSVNTAEINFARTHASFDLKLPFFMDMLVYWTITEQLGLHIIFLCTCTFKSFIKNKTIYR